MKLRILFSFFILIIFSGCNDEVLNVKIEQIKIDAWLNLMPGGPASFHIAAEAVLTNEEENPIENFKVNSILVYQEENLLYKIDPQFVEGEDSIELESNTELKVQFSHKERYEVKKELDAELPITAEFIFSSGDRLKTIRIDDIKIEKVY